MATMPRGEIGNPRNYRSKPNEEWVKDPRTGKYHKNMSFKDSSSGGAARVVSGLSAPKSVRGRDPKSATLTNDPNEALAMLYPDGRDIPELPEMLNPYSDEAASYGADEGWAELFNARQLSTLIGKNHGDSLEGDMGAAARNLAATGVWEPENGPDDGSFSHIAAFVTNNNRGGDYQANVHEHGRELTAASDGSRVPMRYDRDSDMYRMPDKNMYAKATDSKGNPIRDPNKLKWSLPKGVGKSTNAQNEAVRAMHGDGSLPDLPNFLDGSASDDFAFADLHNARQLSQYVNQNGGPQLMKRLAAHSQVPGDALAFDKVAARLRVQDDTYALNAQMNAADGNIYSMSDGAPRRMGYNPKIDRYVTPKATAKAADEFSNPISDPRKLQWEPRGTVGKGKGKPQTRAMKGGREVRNQAYRDR